MNTSSDVTLITVTVKSQTPDHASTAARFRPARIVATSRMPEHNVVHADGPCHPATGFDREQPGQGAVPDEVDEVGRLQPGDERVDDEHARQTDVERDVEPLLDSESPFVGIDHIGPDPPTAAGIQ